MFSDLFVCQTFSPHAEDLTLLRVSYLRYPKINPFLPSNEVNVRGSDTKHLCQNFREYRPICNRAASCSLPALLILGFTGMTDTSI